MIANTDKMDKEELLRRIKELDEEYSEQDYIRYQAEESMHEAEGNMEEIEEELEDLREQLNDWKETK